ncbi:MAG: hypothetical protein H8E13_08015 [Actinobacteria bacterium]|nr:hypothetical protein [Actinomycetota bacterium]
MVSLNSAERVINTFEGKQLDRLPIFDIIHNVNLIEYISEEKITSDNAERTTCKAVSKILDLVRHFTIPDNLEERVITDEDGFSWKIEWWTKSLIKKPIKSLEDVKELMKRDIEKIYRCIDNELLCPQVTKHYCQLLVEDCNTPEEVLDKFKRISNKLGDTVMIAPESLAGIYIALTRYGFDWFSYMIYDYPDLTLKYMDALCDYELFRVKSFAPSKLTQIALVSGIPSSNNGPIFSPEFTKKFLFPRIKKIIEAWKSYGYYVLFFADGSKWTFIDEILSYGADGIDPCEPLAGMNVKEFRDKYPDYVIGSMIDCQNLLPFGTPDDVSKATLKAIKDSGGFKALIGSTSEIHPKVKLENALAMYDTARNYKI